MLEITNPHVYLIVGQAAVQAKIDWPKDVVVPLVTMLLSALIAWLISRNSERKNEHRDVQVALKHLIDYSIEYPYLESKVYCTDWNALDSNLDNDLRYQNYCCFVFNLLELIFKFYRGQTKKMLKTYHVDELIGMHHSWWEKDRENNSYDKRFRDFIDQRWTEIETTKEIRKLEK